MKKHQNYEKFPSKKTPNQEREKTIRSRTIKHFLLGLGGGGLKP